MAPLKRLTTAVTLALIAPVHAETVEDWRPYIQEASQRFGVPAAWIQQVMRAESGGQTRHDGRPIRSSAGAMGLMQIMPATWAEMRARLGLGADPHDPRDNIFAGTFYLRLMYDRFGYPGLFAAYNAGPARYADYLAGRSSLPSETVGYLASVAPSPSGAQIPINRAESPPSIFALRRDVQAVGPMKGSSPPTSLLFVALSRAD